MSSVSSGVRGLGQQGGVYRLHTVLVSACFLVSGFAGGRGEAGKSSPNQMPDSPGNTLTDAQKCRRRTEGTTAVEAPARRAGRRAGPGRLAFALPPEPGPAPPGHPARARLGTPRCRGRSLLSEVTHLIKDTTFRPIKHFQ